MIILSFQHIYGSSSLNTSSGYSCWRLSLGMYRVPVNPLKYFPSSGCGLNGCWGSSLKFAASERNEWHLRCCYVEQSFLYATLSWEKLLTKSRVQCSLATNVLCLSLVRALFPCLKNMHRGISARQKGHSMKARKFLPVQGATERWTDKIYFTST